MIDDDFEDFATDAKMIILRGLRERGASADVIAAAEARYGFVATPPMPTPTPPPVALSRPSFLRRALRWLARLFGNR